MLEKPNVQSDFKNQKVSARERANSLDDKIRRGINALDFDEPIKNLEEFQKFKEEF